MIRALSAEKFSSKMWKQLLGHPVYHFIRIYHQQASERYCFLSLARAKRTWHILNEVDRLRTRTYEFKLFFFINLSQLKPV